MENNRRWMNALGMWTTVAIAVAVVMAAYCIEEASAQKKFLIL